MQICPGHNELATRTGARIYLGATAGTTFPDLAFQDGFKLRLGRAKITDPETPGPMPESICPLPATEEKSGQPWAVLSGDPLFVGDVGRPDLSPAYTPKTELAGFVRHSLQKKLLTLPDDLLVYPTDGGWVALWAEYAGGVVVDDRNGAADQLRIRDPEPGAILSRAGKQPSGSSGILPEG